MPLSEMGSSTLHRDLHQQKMHQAGKWPQVTSPLRCLLLEATDTEGRQSLPASRGVHQNQRTEPRLPCTEQLPPHYHWKQAQTPTRVQGKALDTPARRLQHSGLAEAVLPEPVSSPAGTRCWGRGSAGRPVWCVGRAGASGQSGAVGSRSGVTTEPTEVPGKKVSQRRTPSLTESCGAPQRLRSRRETSRSRQTHGHSPIPLGTQLSHR